MEFYRDFKNWSKQNLSDALRMVADYSFLAGMAAMRDRQLRYECCYKCAHLVRESIVAKFGR